MSKMENKKNYASAELFVETWRDCESIDEVADALLMTRGAAASRAYNYRKIGVDLKQMPRAGGGRGSRLDIAKLNAIIANGADPQGNTSQD